MILKHNCLKLFPLTHDNDVYVSIWLYLYHTAYTCCACRTRCAEWLWLHSPSVRSRHIAYYTIGWKTKQHQIQRLQMNFDIGVNRCPLHEIEAYNDEIYIIWINLVWIYFITIYFVLKYHRKFCPVYFAKKYFITVYFVMEPAYEHNSFALYGVARPSHESHP